MLRTSRPAAGVTSSSNGTLATVNIFSPDYVNDILLRDTYSSGSFSQRVYFTHDANYDVTAVIGTSGTVLQRQVYSAYGTVSSPNSNWVSTTDGYSLTHLWQGGWRDAITEMYLFEARWYSTTAERWISTDPIGYGDGLNDYLGFGANPVARRMLRVQIGFPPATLRLRPPHRLRKQGTCLPGNLWKSILILV